MRYNINMIYSYTGKFLISVNPIKNLGLYTTELINDYQNKRLVEPHLFQIANNTYSQLHLSIFTYFISQWFKEYLTLMYRIHIKVC